MNSTNTQSNIQSNNLYNNTHFFHKMINCINLIKVYEDIYESNYNYLYDICMKNNQNTQHNEIKQNNKFD